MDAAPTPPDEPVDFTLRFLDGRGLLGLRSPVRVALASLERLELEVPNLRFPFDLSGGPRRFQNRRCRFREARITLAEARLAEWLAGRRLASFGIERASLRVGEGRLHLAFEALVGDRAVPATARLRVEPATTGDGPARRVRLVVAEVRTYGWLPVPWPLVGMALLIGAGAQPSEEGSGAAAPLVLRGVSEAVLDALDEVLWHALVPVGWRLPARGTVRASGIRLTAGRIELAFSDGAAPALAPAPGEGPRCPAGEERLAANDLDGALAAFRAAWEASPHPQLFDRILSLLVASPERWDEALAFAEAAGARSQDGAPSVAPASALLALGTIEAERGAAARAAGRFAELAELARVAGDLEDEAAALLRAAELYRASEPARATPLLERLARRNPPDPRAAALLAECYAKEQRWSDLARLEGERVGLAEGPEELALAHARLGRVLLDHFAHLGQAARAKDELERAVRLNTFDAQVWFLLGRAYAATGEPDRAIGALDCVVTLSHDAALKADAHVGAARLLLESAPRSVEPALARFQAALAIDPRHPQALAGEAELYARTGRFEDAKQAFERAFASVAVGAPGPAGNAERRRLLLAEAERSRERGAPEAARELLERALGYGEDREVLDRVAALAEAEGRHADAEHLLGRLAALGDQMAGVRRARALLRLGDPASALEAVDEACASDARAPSPGFDQVLASQLAVDCCRALGDTAGLRVALDRLLARRNDPAARFEAASLAVAGGEPEVAERYLAQAGDHRPSLELRADLLESRGDDEGLDDTLNRLVHLLGDDPAARARVLLRQAAIRTRADRLTDALACYRAAVALLPEGASDEGDAARAGQGRTAYLLERWDEARAAWEPLHDRGVPPRAQRALRLGEIAMRQHDSDAARRFYRAALDLGLSGGDVARCYDALVTLAEGRGDARGAIEVLVEAAQSPRSGESPGQRVERLTSAARRLAELGDREAAARCFERALGIDAESRDALDGLDALAAQSGDKARAADVLTRRAEAARARPRERKALLVRLAELQGGDLRRTELAHVTHREILQIDPDHRASLAFLAREARLAEERDEELRQLERLARVGGGEVNEQSAVHARLARLHAEAGREREAEREARRAIELSPRQAAALQLLDELLSRQERWPELEPLLAMRAEVEAEFERALDLEYRRAAILERLGRDDDALAAYDRIVQVRPTAAAAWDRMATLHRRASAWQPLLDVLGRLAAGRAASGEPAEAAAVVVEMSHLAHDRLGDPALSRRCLERALSYDPRCTLALDGLLALARIDGDAAAEDELLGRRVDAETDPEQREALLTERARGRRDRGELDGALALLDEVPAQVAGDALLRLRVQLADDKRAPQAAVAALEELARRARRVGDVPAERDLARRLSRLAAQEKRRGPEAEGLFRRALELDPDDVDSAQALVEVERERRDAGERLHAYTALLRALRRRRREPAREAEAAVELAKLLRDAGDLAGSSARLREALALQPDRVDVMALLGEALYEQGELDTAIRLLEQAIERQPDRGTWALLGVAYEAHGNVAKAAAAFDAAGDAADPKRRADALERAGREDEALALWRTVGGETGRRRAAALLLRWARQAHIADRSEEASRLAVEALHEGPCEPDALGLASANLDSDGLWALVERLTAKMSTTEAAALWRAASALLPPSSARAALERAVAAEPDAESLAALARREGGEAGATRAREALRLDPTSSAAALALAALSQGPDVLPALRAAWRAVPPNDRPPLSLAMARQLRDAARDPAAARDAWRRALDEGASGEAAGEALRALAGLDAEARDTLGAIGWLRTARQRGLANDDDLRRLAELLGDRGEHEESVTLLREAGAPPPLLARALEAAGHWTELADLLEKSAYGAPPATARAALVHAATLRDERLGDAARAADLLARAIPLGPDDADLWAHLGRLYAGPLGDPGRAATAFTRAHGADPGRGDVLLPLGDHHLAAGDLDAAEDCYRRAIVQLGLHLVGAARTERGALRVKLADVAARRGNPTAEEIELRAAAADGAVAAWSRLAERYRQLGDGERRAEALLAWAELEPARQADLYREARTLLDPAEAVRIDDLITRLDPSDDATRSRVLGRLRATGDDAALARRLAQELERSPESARAALRWELAEVCERLGDEEGAFAAWSAHMRETREPGDAGAGRAPEAARRLIAAARRVGQGAAAATLIEAALGERGEGMPAIVAEAWLAPGGDRERARPWVDRAIAEARSGGARGLRYRSLLRAAGRWSELVAELDAEAAQAGGKDRFALELEAASIVEDRLREPAAAAARFGRAYDLAPEEHDVATHGRSLYLSVGDRTAALALLEHEIAVTPESEQAPLLALRDELRPAAAAPDAPSAQGEQERPRAPARAPFQTPVVPIATPPQAGLPSLVGATALPDDAEIDIAIDVGDTTASPPPPSPDEHFEDISLDDLAVPRPPPPPARGARELNPDDFALLPTSRPDTASFAGTAPAGSSTPPAGTLVTPPPAADAARRNDTASLYATLKAQLDRLPLDAVDRITELRQNLGDLAHRLRDEMAAASYYELVLAQHPERIEVLRPLVDIYTATREWERCAEVMGRLAYLARTSEERAEWTYRQAEILRHHLHDEEAAAAGYLRAADYHPEHAPTLRRLIAFYFAEGEIGSLLEVLAELERQGEAIGDSVVEAGLGLLVAGEDGRATSLVAGADARRLAEVLASIRIDDPRYIDQVLRAAARALAGPQSAAREPSAGREDAAALSAAIEAILVDDPSRIGARMAAARLAERMEDIPRARAHLAVLAWVDPEGDAARRMAELPEPVLSPEPSEPVHPAARGPLREALRLLGPLTVGVGAPMPGAEPNPVWAARLYPLATVFGFEQIDAAVVEEQGEPVWAEPTAPARLLIRRDMLSDEPAVEFGAARALHLLRAGVPVVDERAEEDLAALLAAAAALFDPAVKVENPLEQAWLAALRSLPFHPEALPADRRAALQQALRSCAEPGVAATGPHFCRAERFTADRVAFALGGDVGAALRALVPDATSNYVGKRARAALLSAHDPVRELLAYVFSHEGLRRLGEDD